MELTAEQQNAWIAALTNEGDAFIAWKRAAEELDTLRKELQQREYVKRKES